jgi:hypothetical protein
VDSSQKKQGVRGWNVKQKPPMQEFVQAALAIEFALLLADIF